MNRRRRLVAFSAIALVFFFDPGSYGSRSAAQSEAHAEAVLTPFSIPHQPLLAGDLVFRLGRSLGSQAVISVDPTSPYSHVGILVQKDDSAWNVIHVMPLPATETSPARLDPLAEFISPDQAAAFAFYRLRDDSDGKTGALAAKIARDFCNADVIFDSHFDLSSD